MSSDAPTGIRLSQEQIRLVEFAIKEAVMEEVDARIAAASTRGDAETSARIEALQAEVAHRAAPVTISKVPSARFLAAVGLGVVGVTAAMVLLLLPGQVDSSLDQRADDITSMAADLEEAHATILGRAAESDSLTRVIAQRADDLELAAGSAAFRAEVAQTLKSDSEFLRLTAGPPGPRGPTGEPPPGIRFIPGAAFFEAGGVALASMGRSGQGGGYAQVHNTTGSRVAFLGSSGAGDGLVSVSDSRDGATADIRTGADSSALILQNGTALAYLATPNRGTAQLTVGNRAGDGGVTLRSRDGLGAIMVNGRTAHDLAEVFELAGRAGVAPGVVMSAVGDGGGLAPSRGAYDRRVVGVVSGAGGYVPGMVLGSRADGSTDLPVAINGQVFVRADLSGGAIRPGDLLVASDAPGTAMRGTDPARLIGAVIGKALEPFGEGDEDGLVKILVMTR